MMKYHATLARKKKKFADSILYLLEMQHLIKDFIYVSDNNLNRSGAHG